MAYEYDKKGDYEQDLGAATHVQPIDYEVGPTATEGLKRQLKARHIAMISLGGVIGTGLFLGTGGALRHGGPLGLFLGYAIVGSVCYCVMVSLGEVISYLPIQGGHIRLASRFVDPALGFAMGWNYWYNWCMILPAELSACAILIHLWNDTISDGVWITVIMVFIVAINLLGAGAYGEAEFWFSSIKILTIVGLIILSIILTAGGGPNHKAIGFEYWKNPGPLVQYGGISGATGRFLGIWSVLTQAAFSYIGTEIVAVAAGEAKNPRRNIPRAIKTVFVRICIFYLCGTFVIGLICPSNEPDLNLTGSAKSPFVIAIKKAGIPALPSIINACLITSAASAASSDLYTNSRALYSLALVGEAPKIFTRTTRRGLPWVSLIVGVCFAFLAYMTLGTSAGNVFNYFQNLTACAGLLTWWGISLLYIRFRKGMIAQGIDRKQLPYWSYANSHGIAAYYAITLITIILIFSGWTVFLKGEWDTPTFVTNYLPLVLFPILWVGWKFWKKTEWRKPEEMDFVTDVAEIEAEVWEDDEPKNLAEKIWKVII